MMSCSPARRAGILAAGWVLFGWAGCRPPPSSIVGDREQRAPITEVRPEARWGKGWRAKAGELLFVHLEGTPYEMGQQHGELLKEEIRAFRDDALAYIATIVEHFQGLPVEDLDQFIAVFVPLIASKYLPFLSAAHVEEMQGIADATGIPFDEIVLPNVVWEIKEVFLEHCSEFGAFGEATVDGKIYHGFNMDTWDVPSTELWNNHSVVAFFHPSGRKSFAAVTTVGTIGLYSGVNEEGISIGWDNTVTDAPIDPPFFEPFMFTIRRTLEEASTIERAVELITAPYRPLADITILADGKSGRAVALETFAGHHAVREAHKGVVFSANHFASPAMEPYDLGEFTGDAEQDMRLNSRHVRYGELLLGPLHGKLDVPSSISVLRDPYPTGDPRFGYNKGQRCPICRDTNQLSILYSPGDLMFWVSTQTRPACAGRFIGFDQQREAPLAEALWVEEWNAGND